MKLFGGERVLPVLLLSNLGSSLVEFGESDRRVPAELGQESQASSCLRKGTPLASRVARGVSGPRGSLECNPEIPVAP